MALRLPKLRSLINKSGKIRARVATLVAEAKETATNRRRNCPRVFQDSERISREAMTEMMAEKASVSLASATKVATLALILPLLLIKLRSLGKRNAILLLVFPLLFIWVTYGFRSEIIFNRFPTNVPFGGYLRAIKENILLARRGQASLPQS